MGTHRHSHSLIAEWPSNAYDPIFGDPIAQLVEPLRTGAQVIRMDLPDFSRAVVRKNDEEIEIRFGKGQALILTHVKGTSCALFDSLRTHIEDALDQGSR